MLETLSQGFQKARDRLKGRVELTADNIDEAIKDIRESLLDADVHLRVTKGFLERVKATALGEIVETRVRQNGKRLKASPGDHFINICYNELVGLMGPVDTSLQLKTAPVATIMLLGLQGCGKKTTAGKVARHLLAQDHKPLLVAADIYRPAAVEQLQVIGSRLNVPVFSDPGATPQQICKRALDHARIANRDVVIFDTAGRLAIDEELMRELEEIATLTRPDNTLLVCDAMIGQDAVNTAQEFTRRLPVTGFIMTKLDGDARGGAALSIKEVTGTPIKFLGTGENLEGLEEFRPEGLASRILGFGDVVGLMKDFEGVVDEKQAEADARRMLKGQFTLNDFLQQIQSIKKMGPLQDLVEKIPFFSQLSGGAAIDEREIVRVESIIRSMTPHERQHPDIIHDSRKQRIAGGCGRSARDVTEILKRYKKMREMMKNMGKSGLLSKLSTGLANMPGVRGNPALADMEPEGPPLSSIAIRQNVSSAQRRKNKSKRKQSRQARKKGRKR